MDTSHAHRLSVAREAFEAMEGAIEGAAFATIRGKRLDELTEAEFYAGAADLPENAWVLLDQDDRISGAAMSDGLQRPNDPLDDTVLVYGSRESGLTWCTWDDFSGGCPVAAMKRDDAKRLGYIDDDERLGYIDDDDD